MITDNDIKKLKKVFVTKEDLMNFATKDDLKGFATKEDLEKLKKVFVTKEEHKASIERVIKHINYRLEPLDELIHEFREFKEQMSKTMDFLVGAYQKLTDEHIVATEQYSRLDRGLQNHEARITTIEKKVN